MKFLALLPLLIASHAWAGADSSGGGNALVCFNDASIPQQIRLDGGNLSNKFIPHVVSVETYDLYAARKKYGDDGIWQLGEMKPLEYINLMNSQLQLLVPGMSEEIARSAQMVPKDQIINQPFGLEKIDDVGANAPYDASKCVLATMATHYRDGDEYFLHLDRRLYDHPSHSKLSKTVLLLHEFAYMAARRKGATTSKNTRELVGLMIAKRSGLTAQQWIDKVFELGLSGDKKYFGYPGTMAYKSVLKMFDIASKLQVSFYALAEPPRVAAANQALAPFGKKCWMPNALGCVQTIEALEYAKTPGVEQLKPLKDELNQIVEKKVENTQRQLVDFYFSTVKPSFAKVPYKLRKPRDTFVEESFSVTVGWILDQIRLKGEINEMDPEKYKFYESNADGFAHYMDLQYNLDANPLED